MNKQLTAVTFLKKEHIKEWEAITADWEKYFKIDHVKESPTKIKSYLDKPLDFVFIAASALDKFEPKMYRDFKDKERFFKFVVIKDKHEEDDYKILKSSLADDIVYLEDARFAKWKTLALLRRYWDTHSLPTTKIYKNIVINYLDNEVLLNGEQVELTEKEFAMLKLFVNNAGKFLQKDKVFTQIWGIKDKDTTRVVDQIIFKLKKKIGKEYFESTRQKSIKFE